MRSRFRRIVGPVLAVIGLTGAALLAPASPAGAAPQPIGRCTASSGVVLAVDFSHWGGPVYRSCGTTPTTGYERVRLCRPTRAANAPGRVRALRAGA
ncbi:hypothetical protein SMICM304S_03090 [Streptomyces microflavus]